MIGYINRLCSISPRYGVNEIKAAKIITDELDNLNIAYVYEPFDSSVPKTIKAELFADNVLIPCLSSTFQSGVITSLNQIHFSPYTDDISVVSFYDEPSVTVSKSSFPIIQSAKEIRGMVEIAVEKFTTANILVGNSINPKNIIFAHYDSVIGPGALDNAAAVAVLMDIIISNPKLLQTNLFVFAGNEEISYDKGDYDSHGFRVFESIHHQILKSVTKIIIVDGIGVSSPTLTQEDINLVFLLSNLSQYLSKCFWLQNDQNLVLQNYHSITDTVDKINLLFLEEAKELLIKKIL